MDFLFASIFEAFMTIHYTMFVFENIRFAAERITGKYHPNLVKNLNISRIVIILILDIVDIQMTMVLDLIMLFVLSFISAIFAIPPKKSSTQIRTYPDENKTKYQLESRQILNYFLEIKRMKYTCDKVQLKKYVSKEIFEKYCNSMEYYHENDVVKDVDNYENLRVEIISFTHLKNEDIIHADIMGVMAGDKSTKEDDIPFLYNLVFSKKKNLKEHNCDNCNALMNDKQIRCDYCNTLLSYEDGGWKLISEDRIR